MILNRRDLLPLVSFALALGCGQSLPQPVVRAVEPASFEEGQAPLLRVEIDAVLPFSVDYGEDTASVGSALTVSVGEQPLALTGPLADGAVTGVPPFALSQGAHDVTVSLADGRRGTLVGGLKVVPGRFPEAFVFDTIPEQKRGQPFDITLRGEGGRAAEFSGVVRLSVSKGTISPEVTGAFVNGVRTERVSVEAPASEIVITVEDAAEHTGTSNMFRVRP
ncbi:MAG: hypothetical protein WBV82_33395 [Myxococcaceae bacterium]